MNTRLLSANLDFDSLDVYLTNVPTLENFAFFSVFGLNLVLTSGLGATNVSRGCSFNENTSFSCHGICSSCGNSRVRGIFDVLINSVGIW